MPPVTTESDIGIHTSDSDMIDVQSFAPPEVLTATKLLQLGMSD